MAYSGICCLLILGDNLEGVERASLLASLKSCQKADGSFRAQPTESESDMRFVYCAVVIASMLDAPPRTFDEEAVCGFIRASFNYDGGFGQCPALESHGGSTFCALATLRLLGRLWDGTVLTARQVDATRRWCLRRQSVGLHGRANKPDDACYTFWIGGALALLDSRVLADSAKARQFTLTTQDPIMGGFAKFPDVFPDALHTYFSLAGLSLLKEPNLLPVDAALNVTERARSHLLRVQKSWR